VGDGSAARAVIRSLTCSGQTNIEAGLRAAYGTLAPDGGSVVLLLSDGVPDGGLSTPTELGTLAADARSRMGATTLTIGLGNQFHAGILRAVANRGGGDFRVAPSAADLAQLLTAELEAHANIVARDVAVDVALAPGVTLDAAFDATSIDAGVRIEGGRVSIRIAALAAGETRTIVLPIAVAAPGAVATVQGHASTAGVVVQGERALSVRASAQAIPAGGLAATLDADLASALVASASAVENGQTAAASAALRAHAERARAIASGDPAILARVQAALSFAAGLDATVPSASWGARRQASYAILEWSVGLSR
jgi:Ca-activated chloride channel family protein